MDNIIKWVLQPSTIRGLIISVGTLAGFVLHEAKIEAILTLSGLALGLHELVRHQYDVKE